VSVLARPERVAVTSGNPPRGAGASARTNRWNARNRRDFFVFLAFALPNLLLIAAFTYRPLLSNVYYSTLDWTLGSPTATPIGLGNYREFFGSPDSWDILGVTAVFTVATIGGSMILGLLVALALNRKVRGSGFARATVFAPFVLSGVGVGLVWVFLFDPTTGAFAAVLRMMGLHSPEWFNNPRLSLVMVIIVYIWKNLGYAAVIYLAALQSVSKDVLEAAAIDGAGGIRAFRSITLPLISPTTFFLLITSILNSLQAFDLIRIMTPLGTGTTTLIYDAYLQAFGSYNRGGYSAAISTILFVLLLALTVFQLKFLERKVHY
jgi:sn-glycerol 3-phosphate transport system permease protein